MAPKLPVVKPREVVKALEKAGWEIHRQKGSHAVMHKKGSKRIVVIPLHSGDMPRGTLHGILEDADIAVEQFVELL